MPDTLNNFEPFFPGFPVMGSQTSTRIQFANTLRSTIGANLVNEARFGYSGAPVEFFNEQIDAGLVERPLAQPGWVPPAASARPASPTPVRRRMRSRAMRSTFLIEDTLNWLRARTASASAAR